MSNPHHKDINFHIDEHGRHYKIVETEDTPGDVRVFSTQLPLEDWRREKAEHERMLEELKAMALPPKPKMIEKRLFEPEWEYPGDYPVHIVHESADGEESPLLPFHGVIAKRLGEMPLFLKGGEAVVPTGRKGSSRTQDVFDYRKRKDVS